MTDQQVITDSEASEIVRDLRDTAVEDVVKLKRRIADLKIDYVTDPWEETAAQIDRLENRLERRIQEAAALAIVLSKFDAATVLPTRETHDINECWRFVVLSYADWSVNRADWSDNQIFDFVAKNHVNGLEHFRKYGG